MKTYKDQNIYLMCPPEYYRISKPHQENGSANDFAIEGWKTYSKNPTAFQRKSEKQWTKLTKLIQEELGGMVHILPPQKELEDQVFTADPSLSITVIKKFGQSLTQKKTVTILSQFSNEEREGEVTPHLNHLTIRFQDRLIVKAAYRTEGTGDNVYDAYRDVYWSGYTFSPGRNGAASGRSDIRAHQHLESLSGVEVISFNVQRPYFHIDTTLAPLSKGHILCYAGGLSPESLHKMQDKAFEQYGLPVDEFLIPVSKDDAACYACNLICEGDTIIMPECSDDLKTRLMQKGYKVHTTDLTQFIYAGGGPHCLVNNLTQERSRQVDIARPSLKFG